MPQVTELTWPVLLLFCALLFVAVAAGTYLGLTIAYPVPEPLSGYGRVGPW